MPFQVRFGLRCFVAEQVTISHPSVPLPLVICHRGQLQYAQGMAWRFAWEVGLTKVKSVFRKLCSGQAVFYLCRVVRPCAEPAALGEFDSKSAGHIESWLRYTGRNKECS
jgi:hypothetical protein